MSTGHNRAAAKLAGKRRAAPRGRTSSPSTAPYAAAAALTTGDVGDVQECIENAPTPEVLAELDQAAGELEQAVKVELAGHCPKCGGALKLAGWVQIPSLAKLAGRLRVLRDKLAKFDGRVLQRIVDHLGEGASLWFTGKGG